MWIVKYSSRATEKNIIDLDLIKLANLNILLEKQDQNDYQEDKNQRDS